MNKKQAQNLLAEAIINLKSHRDDENYDLSELVEEIEELEDFLAAGDFDDEE